MFQSRSLRLSRWPAAAAAILSLFIATRTPPLSAMATPVADDGWDAFSADVSLQQALVSSTGTILQTPPAIDMRIERVRRSTGWRTNVTLRRLEQPVVRAGSGTAILDNPFLVVRMEYDGDGTAPRFFNQAGLRVNPPGDLDRALLEPSMASTVPEANLGSTSIIRTRFVSSNPDWIDNVVATPAKRLNRRAAIEQRYGPKRGRVNGMDRYLANAGDMTCELLVNSAAVVPVELNVARSTALIGRSLFTYEMKPDGVMIRRVLHAERAVAIGSNNRIVADVTMSNVSLSNAGAQ